MKLSDVIVGQEYQVDYNGHGVDEPRRVRAVFIGKRSDRDRGRRVRCLWLGGYRKDSETWEHARDLMPWADWQPGYAERSRASSDRAALAERVTKALKLAGLDGFREAGWQVIAGYRQQKEYGITDGLQHRVLRFELVDDDLDRLVGQLHRLVTAYELAPGDEWHATGEGPPSVR